MVYASKYRQVLVQISSDLGVAEHPRLQAALASDRAALADIVPDIIYSPAEWGTVLTLEGDAAQSFLDIIQDTLANALLRTREATSKARRLIGELATACGKLPSSLIISGVTERDECPTFWYGYGDSYKASYKGTPVILKRIRVSWPTDERHAWREFCSEALLWQCLRHPNIVPLIGVDTESFPLSLCMVSPWMKNGTVLQYLRDSGDIATATRWIREIAQGLDYLHEQHIVHGALRGANILVDDNGHACLTEFWRA
ncbi:kinase-like domain-containing protein [Mycena vulgaris]|nr:kinase-like domain-containing protein [Mycena vulgaris]